MPLKLHVIVCSTRPGRIGPSVGRWFHGFAQAHGGFEAELVDLADFSLPLYDEPKHPVFHDYQHDHTKRWGASVEQADAFAFVMPEYNYNPPPSFYNAVDLVLREWHYKPAGLVSYGGVSGGLRAAQAAKSLLSAVKMVPITEGVPIPMVGQLLDAEKQFGSNELIDKSAKTMLDELVRWATALKTMRTPA
jgi:NAD(P)H-dependent FMN reductase